MDEEETKKREKAWKTVQYTFWGFGGTFTILGAWLFYEFGKFLDLVLITIKLNLFCKFRPAVNRCGRQCG